MPMFCAPSYLVVTLLVLRVYPKANCEVTDQSPFIRTIQVLLVFVLWLHVQVIDHCSNKNTKHKTIDPSQPYLSPPPSPPTGIRAFHT